MPRKNLKEVNEMRSYLGADVPTPFFLRFQAMAEIRAIDRKILISMAVENDINEWEKTLDLRGKAAYDALLEAKARAKDYSVDQLKAELNIIRSKRRKPTLMDVKAGKPIHVPTPSPKPLKEFYKGGKA